MRTGGVVMEMEVKVGLGVEVGMKADGVEMEVGKTEGEEGR